MAPPPPRPRRDTRALLRGIADWRRWRAHHFAYAGGLLMLLAGGASGTASVVGITEGLAEAAPGPAGAFFLTISGLLLFVSNLGGTSVLIGGYLAEKKYPRLLASVFISLGAGLDLAGLVVEVLVLLPHPDQEAALLVGLLTSISGLGVAFALWAQARLFRVTLVGLWKKRKERAGSG